MRKTALLAVLIATMMVVPIAAYAISSFTDVPVSAFFHNSVDWMKTNNITVGCNPPANDKYCPNDDVSRGEMAVFFKRLAENKVVDAATAVTATNATNATNADNADTVAGLTPSELAPFSIIGETDATTYGTDLSFKDITSASTSITVPAGQTAVIVARFTGESMCTGGSWASVRLVLDGSEMSPVVGTNFAFDSSDLGTETSSSWESHAVERFEGDVGAGTYVVKAQVSVGCTTFRIDDWTLVAEARLGGSAALVSLPGAESDSQGR